MLSTSLSLPRSGIHLSDSPAQRPPCSGPTCSGLSMAELAKQIYSHVGVIDVDIPANKVAPEGQNSLEVTLTLTLPTPGEVSSTSPVVT